MRDFSSNATASVDDKGRVSVPHQLRAVLEAEGGGRLHLVPGFRDPRAIEGFTPRGFEDICDAIRDMDWADPDRQKLEWKVIGRASAAVLDDAGRIVLNRELRDEIGIGKRALFVGAGETLQIWEPEAHAAAMAALFGADAARPAAALMPRRRRMAE